MCSSSNISNARRKTPLRPVVEGLERLTPVFILPQDPLKRGLPNAVVLVVFLLHGVAKDRAFLNSHTNMTRALVLVRIPNLFRSIVEAAVQLVVRHASIR